jgi:hypothetical protein
MMLMPYLRPVLVLVASASPPSPFVVDTQLSNPTYSARVVIENSFTINTMEFGSNFGPGTEILLRNNNVIQSPVAGSTGAGGTGGAGGAGSGGGGSSGSAGGTGGQGGVALTCHIVPSGTVCILDNATIIGGSGGLGGGGGGGGGGAVAIKSAVGGRGGNGITDASWNSGWDGASGQGGHGGAAGAAGGAGQNGSGKGGGPGGSGGAAGATGTQGYAINGYSKFNLIVNAGTLQGGTTG